MKLLTAWCVLVLQALAAGEGPETPAVRYLEKIRDGAVNLEPGGDTAMATQTVEEKRAGIAQRIKRLSADLGKLPLEAGSSRVDGDLAAVMVGQSAGADFDAYQVTAVALVKRGESWLPAPLPGSYQNAGLSYEPAVRQRAKRLEDWMVDQKGPELERLRSKELAILRRQIGEALPMAEWKVMGSSQCAERFFKACESGELTVLAGLLGGTSSPLPDDWGQSWKVAVQALDASAKVPRQWRLMMAPGVLRIPLPVQESGDRARIPVVCLDPAGAPPKLQKPRMEEILLELEKSADGLWTVSPPAAGLAPVREDERPENMSNSSVDVLTEIWLGRFPPAAHADPRAAVDALLAAFRSPSGWLSHLKPAGDGNSLCKSLEAAASVWRGFCYPRSSRYAVELGTFGDDRHRVFVFQVFSSTTPDRMELHELHFVKSGSGWFWEPCPPVGEAAELIKGWRERSEKEWSGVWRSVMLKSCVRVDGLADIQAPAADDARRVVNQWNHALCQGDVATAIGLTAHLSLPDSEGAVLRNLAYEMNAVRSRSGSSEVGEVLLSRPWALVSMRPAPDSGPAGACFPVIRTAGGPKILLETDLVASASRGRKYLNGESFRRLAKFDPDASSALETLFESRFNQPQRRDGREGRR